MQAEAQPHEVEHAPDDQLRAGVPTTHAGDGLVVLIR